MSRKDKTEFTDKARKEIHKRDEENCVLCALEYRMEEAIGWAPLQVMHIVPRSQLGQGVEENGALGCVGHHALMDNGNKECREEMQKILEDRMRFFYPGWTRESVTYKKHGGQPRKAAAGSRTAPDPGDGFTIISDSMEDDQCFANPGKTSECSVGEECNEKTRRSYILPI